MPNHLHAICQVWSALVAIFSIENKFSPCGYSNHLCFQMSIHNDHKKTWFLAELSLHAYRADALLIISHGIQQIEMANGCGLSMNCLYMPTAQRETT